MIAFPLPETQNRRYGNTIFERPRPHDRESIWNWETERKSKRRKLHGWAKVGDKRREFVPGQTRFYCESSDRFNRVVAAVSYWLLRAVPRVALRTPRGNSSRSLLINQFWLRLFRLHELNDITDEWGFNQKRNKPHGIYNIVRDFLSDSLNKKYSSFKIFIHI